MERTPDGRRARIALAEIPLRLDRLRVTQPLQPLHPTNTNNDRLTQTALQPLTNMRERSPALPPGYLSPAPSPDELLIQQRGRKRMPATWSPDIELKRSSTFHSLVRTPPKNTPTRGSPSKLGVTLRSTPRKRLLLGDERIPLTPEKIDFSDISTPKKFKLSSPVKTPSKKSRLDKTLESEFQGPLDAGLKGLSPTQLVNMIKQITSKHPEIEDEIRKEMPKPDLGPIEEKLTYLKSNIFKSLPTSRLISKTDSPAYSRVAIHLAAFKKFVVEQGKILVESQHWESVVQYVTLAWGYVKATPVWDNQPHNALRKQCFRALTTFCMSALKKGSFEKDVLDGFLERFQHMVSDSDEIQSCIKFVQGQLKDM